MFASILLKKFAYSTIEDYINPLKYYSKQANFSIKYTEWYCECDKKKFIVLKINQINN